MNEADAVLIADVIGNVVLLGDSLNEVIACHLHILDSEGFNSTLTLTLSSTPNDRLHPRYQCLVICSYAYLNRLFPELQPLFQSETKCEAIDMKIIFSVLMKSSFSHKRLST